MRAFSYSIKKKGLGSESLRARARGHWYMSKLFVSSTSDKSEAATLSSTLDWRAWWHRQSERDHTDWQHLGVDAVVARLRSNSSL
jgi:hypothetical protein